MASDRNTLDPLERQRRDIEELFVQLDEAEHDRRRERLFSEIDILFESLEEYLGIKRVLADFIDIDATDETFDADAKVLKEQAEPHAGEDNEDPFPKVKKICEEEVLIVFAEKMTRPQETPLAEGRAAPGVA